MVWYAYCLPRIRVISARPMFTNPAPAAAEEGDEKKKKPGTSNSHFLTVDAYSDLIVLLIKCCGRGQQQPKQSEGVAFTPHP